MTRIPPQTLTEYQKQDNVIYQQKKEDLKYYKERKQQLQSELSKLTTLILYLETQVK